MMHTRTLSIATILVLLVVLASACAGGAPPAAAPSQSKPAAAKPAAKTAAKAGDAGRGQVLYSQSCTACHGPDAKGLPGLGKDMTTSAFIKDQSDQQLLDFVKKGRPIGDPANTTNVDMPAKGGNPALTDAQLLDIIAFMRSLQR
jgi:disulfide bond formation protein DsbB